MTTGTVKWFSATKACGYVKPDDGEEHLFFQYTTILATGSCTLAEGQRVEFELTKGPKGIQAVNVRPIDYPCLMAGSIYRYASATGS